MFVSIVTPPLTEPITLTEAKNHLRVEHGEDDTLITSLIIAAREWSETFLNKALITQTRKLTMSGWPALPLRLIGAPVQSIDSVEYVDNTGSLLTVDPSEYYLFESGGIALDYDGSWPDAVLRGPESIYITYTCGYGSADDVPVRIKQAMLLLIGGWYENRESIAVENSHKIPFGVEALLWPLREIVV